jgi:hypothetical protein
MLIIMIRKGRRRRIRRGRGRRRKRRYKVSKTRLGVALYVAQ